MGSRVIWKRQFSQSVKEKKHLNIPFNYYENRMNFTYVTYKHNQLYAILSLLTVEVQSTDRQFTLEHCSILCFKTKVNKGKF